MGACCSKTYNTTPSTPLPPETKTKPNPQQPENKNNTPVPIVAPPTEPRALKKDAFLVNHRKSHEIDTLPDQQTRKSLDRNKTPNSGIPQLDAANSDGAGGIPTDESGKLVGATVRTSSCTKEEVDAILIQCGRLSRSSSGVKPAGGETPTRGRRYSGSKRSFDFDMEMDSKKDDDGLHHRREQREARVSSPSRRRSRERDPQQQRSGSKERGSGTGTGGRRVSRSPNRRSESPNPNCNNTNRPVKMVSVPATDKSSNAGGGEVVAGVSGGVKTIQVKRNVGEAVVTTGSRSAGTARSRSPGRQNLKVLNENENQQTVTLGRSNRRNPLCEIDTNAIGSEQPGSKKPNGEKMMNNKAKETQMLDETKTSAENPKQNQIVSRTRSSRLSRDLDINLEALMNPNPNPNPPSYASLLLEDIQNFHHKNPALPISKAGGVLVESEKVVVNDDVMEPSLHKYVTVRRGGDADAEEQESSGSNSFAGSQQLSWMSSSWEPNSGDSTDCCTSKSRLDAGDMGVERSGEYPRNGIGRGRVGSHRRSAYSLPNNATVEST